MVSMNYTNGINIKKKVSYNGAISKEKEYELAFKLSCTAASTSISPCQSIDMDKLGCCPCLNTSSIRVDLHTVRSDDVISTNYIDSIFTPLELLLHRLALFN